MTIETTRELAEAVEFLKDEKFMQSLGFIGREAVATILAALPEEVTRPGPELPNEPGAYHDAGGYLTILTPDKEWVGSYGEAIDAEFLKTPLTRLVPANPPVTYSEILSVVKSEWHHPQGFVNMAEKLADYINNR